MKLIQTGIGITKTIRNVGRLREILSVFAANGFDEILNRTGLINRIPNFVLPKSIRKLEKIEEGADFVRSIGIRVRNSFEELGPSFIKFGQLMSTREDIFPAEFINELRPLQSNVKPIDFDIVKTEIEEAFGKKIDEIFLSVDSTPLGTASIGVVHRARLITGENVVIKVQRPKIREKIVIDFELLSLITESIEKASDELKILGVSRIIKDFAKSIQNELDFNFEAQNCKRITSNLEKHPNNEIFYLPKIYDDYTCSNILVMEYIDGVPFNSEHIFQYKKEVHEKLNQSLEIFVKTILTDGFFHADLHGGNFLYHIPSKRIGIIDFGLVGAMSKDHRSHFIAIVYSIVSRNFDKLVYEFLDVAEYEKLPNIEELIRDIRESLSPFIGLTVQKINITQLFSNIVNTLVRHQIYLPREWYIVFRALMTMDGVGKRLKIDFDIFGIMEKNILPIAEDMFSKDALMEEGAWIARDLSSIIQTAPRYFRWFVRDLAKNNFTLKIENTGYEEQLRKVYKALVFLGLTFFSITLIIVGLYFVQSSISFRNITTISWIFTLLGIGFFSGSLWFIRK